MLTGLDREDVDRVPDAWVGDHGEAEVSREPVRDRDPGGALVIGAVHAAVVLQVEPLGPDRVARDPNILTPSAWSASSINRSPQAGGVRKRQNLDVRRMVDATGIEPVTPTMST